MMVTFTVLMLLCASMWAAFTSAWPELVSRNDMLTFLKMVELLDFQHNYSVAECFLSDSLTHLKYMFIVHLGLHCCSIFMCFI